jgi:hypothetical protein
MMTAALPSVSNQISTRAARLAIDAIVAYQLLLIALIFLRPDLNPSWHTQRVGDRTLRLGDVAVSHLRPALYGLVRPAQVTVAWSRGPCGTWHPPNLLHWHFSLARRNGSWVTARRILF